MSYDKLIWMDLETTGLDHDEDVILELACVVTDLNFAEVCHYTMPVQPDSLHRFAMMEPFVHDMHETSGLLRDLDRAVSLDKVETGLISYLRDHGVTDKTPMCGSSVHFDRRFIERDMPTFFGGFFTHRNIDVSTVKELVRGWYGENAVFDPAAHATGYYDLTGHVPHRALPDIYASIAELDYYRRSFFFRGGRP